MNPIAVVNRLDLAAADGAHCGEMRLIYARGTRSGPGAFLIIFEGQYPNPQPANGINGCKPVADLWAAQAANTDADALGELEDLFYAGVTTEGGVVLPPAVHFDR